MTKSLRIDKQLTEDLVAALREQGHHPIVTVLSDRVDEVAWDEDSVAFKTEAVKTTEAIARAAALDEAWEQIDHHLAAIMRVCGDFHDDASFGPIQGLATEMMRAIPLKED